MKDDLVYLGYIREAIQDIERYAAVGHDAFVTDRTRPDPDVVVRKLEIIGEGARISPVRSDTAALKPRGSRSPGCAID